MKPKRPKAKRTLADFLNRTDASDSTDAPAGDPEIAPTATVKPAHIIPAAKPEIDPAEKQRLREAQIHEAELIHKEELTAKPYASTRRETQARELLQGITELAAFREATDKWARGNSICWEGAWLGAIAPMVAGTVQRFRRPMLVVLAQHQDAETVARDLDFFLDRNCDVFPPSSDDIDVDSLQQQEVIQRLQVLSRLDACQTHRQLGSNTKADIPVIVTTIPALMHRVPSPHQLRQDRRSLSVGQRSTWRN